MRRRVAILLVSFLSSLRKSQLKSLTANLMVSLTVGLTVSLTVSLLVAAPLAPVRAAELDDVRAELARDIQAAQRALAATEAELGQQRLQLAQQLGAAQNRVLELRERAVVARRLADEETLSLSQIETRLAAWREQSQFQARLLAGYLERLQLRAAVTDADAMTTDLATFGQLLQQQPARLAPRWQARELALADGRLAPVELLQLGPLQWYWQAATASGGLATRSGDHLRSQLAFDGAALAQLQSLHDGGSGQLRFDPTLSRALQLAGSDESLLEHLRKGGLWVLPILLFGVFATLIAAVKAVWLQRLPALVPALAERATTAVQQGTAALQSLRTSVRGAQAELLDIALHTPQREQRDERLYAALLEQRTQLERWLGAVALTASVSPLLGLLGTVSGMITTFKLMTLFGAGDASAVSSGISEALITTELGLVVAIPALLAHALMSRQVKSRMAQLEADAVRLSQLPSTGVAAISAVAVSAAATGASA